MTDLKQYNVTIVRFDPNTGIASGEPFVLPVDSPDVEHAIASTMSNCISFSTKSSGSEPTSIAFTCTAISER